MNDTKNEIDMPELPEETNPEGSSLPETTKTVEETSEKGFRYHCPSCTGNAFFAKTKEEFTNRKCNACGNDVKYDERNYIAL